MKSGAFRELLTYNSNKRSHYNPNLPTLEEIGCQDFPANAMILVGPKGLPEPIANKLGETFKKVSESAAFQSRLASLDLPYDYKGQAELEKEIPQLYEAGGRTS